MPDNLAETMKKCVACELHKTRTQVVMGRGNVHALLWFIGEAPGADEDKKGEAFKGRAGRTLDMCLSRANLQSYALPFNIDNIVKCRPPENRDPTEQEFGTCSESWLYAQLASARPKVIVAMGRYAIGFFRRYPWAHIKKMGVTKEVKKGRFVWQQPASFQGVHRIIVYPTFHPAYVMRNGEVVRGVIKTFMQAKKCLDSLG